MRVALLFLSAILFFACNPDRVYHEYVDFNDRVWLANESARFSFQIEDTTTTYNIYCNLRNSTHYPWSRIFINFSLADTLGVAVEEKLVSEFLFEPKTGKPFGRSGLGDLYDHQIGLLGNYRFRRSGVYEAKLDQLMRTDTLTGVLSVGLAIEKVRPQ